MALECSIEEAQDWAKRAFNDHGLKTDNYASLFKDLSEAFKSRAEGVAGKMFTDLVTDRGPLWDAELNRFKAAWARTAKKAKDEKDHLERAAIFYKSPHFDGRMPIRA